MYGTARHQIFSQPLNLHQWTHVHIKRKKVETEHTIFKRWFSYVELTLLIASTMLKTKVTLQKHEVSIIFFLKKREDMSHSCNHDRANSAFLFSFVYKIEICKPVASSSDMFFCLLPYDSISYLPNNNTIKDQCFKTNQETLTDSGCMAIQ